MEDREYLYELALILDSAESHSEDKTSYIRIEVMSAAHIASRLRQIAMRMPMDILH